MVHFLKVKILEPLMDAKLNSKTHLQKLFIVFSSHSVSFWLQSLQKSAYMTPYFFSLAIIPYGYKKRRIWRWIRRKSLENIYWTKVIGLGTFAHSTFMSLTFSMETFLPFFHRIRNQLQILRLVIPIMILCKTFFEVMLVLITKAKRDKTL